MSSHGRVNRFDLAAWMRRNGFQEIHNKGSGHAYFVHETSGVKVVLPGHGEKELSPKTLGNVLRDLERAGFDKRSLRKEFST